MRNHNGIGYMGCIGLACLTIILSAAGSRAADEADGFFIEGGAGVVFFNPPKRDSLPFYENDTAGNANGRVQPGLAFDASGTAAAGRIALGYRSARSDPGGFLGSHPRITLASDFFSATDSEVRYAAPPNGVLAGTTIPDGWLSAFFFSDAGMEGFTDIGYNGVLAPDALAQVRQTADFDFADFNLSLATDYSTRMERIVVSPQVGLVYALFNQDYRLYAETPDASRHRPIAIRAGNNSTHNTPGSLWGLTPGSPWAKDFLSCWAAH